MSSIELLRRAVEDACELAEQQGEVVAGHLRTIQLIQGYPAYDIAMENAYLVLARIRHYQAVLAVRMAQLVCNAIFPDTLLLSRRCGCLEKKAA